MLSKKSLLKSIIRGITTGTNRKIVVREDGIIDKLLADRDFALLSQWKKMLQMLLLTCGVLLVLYVFVSMVSFFLFNVIFFEPRLYTTSHGSIVITQPCGVEQACFLHNSASLWTDSGIDIVKGDEVEVSYSGSFYSSLLNQVQASKGESPFKYPWSNAKRLEDTKPKVLKYCVLNKNAHIGSLLISFGLPSKDSNIIEVNNKNKIFKYRAATGGTLRVTVNDIFIPTQKLAISMLKENNSVFSVQQKKEIINRLYFQKDSTNKKSDLTKDNLIKVIEYAFCNTPLMLDSLCPTKKFENILLVCRPIQWKQDTIAISYNDFDSVKLCYNYYVGYQHLEAPMLPQVEHKMDSLLQFVKWNAKSIWYDDNIGELFVIVRIKRNNLNYSNPIHRCFAIMYRNIAILWENKTFVLVAIFFCCILIYILFMTTSRRWGKKIDGFFNERENS